MFENMKRMLTLLLAVAMVFSMMPLGVFAENADPQEQSAVQEQPVESLPETTTQAQQLNTDASYVLQLNEALDIQIPEGEVIAVAFTPAVDGAYAFWSEAELDAKAILYDAENNQLEYDDDNGRDMQFLLGHYLTAGQTYYLDVCLWGGSGTVSVYVDFAPLESIEFSPIQVVENTCGQWVDEGNGQPDQWVTYWEYDPQAILENASYAVTFSDGETREFAGRTFDYLDFGFVLQGQIEQNWQSYWTAGNTYTMTATVLGVTVEVPVEVIASPVDSFVFETVEVFENTMGQYMLDLEEEKYWWYDPTSVLGVASCVVTMTDGTVVNVEGSTFTYDGKTHALEASTDQNGSPRWVAGETYSMTVKLWDKTAKLPVTIVKCPVENVEFAPISVFAGMNGSNVLEVNEETQQWEEYWRYDLTDLIANATHTITFADGTTSEGSGTSVSYQGIDYSFQIDSDQSVNNPWIAGNTYTVTVTLMGKEFSVPVTVKETPLVSLEFAPVSVMEKTTGGNTTYYDDETETEIVYWEYSPNALLQMSSFVATFADGTVIESTGTGFEYQGQWHEFTYSTTQDGKPEWQPDNTYAVTISVMQREVEIPVTILPSPLQSLSFTPITVYENTMGWWTEDYNDDTEQVERYYCYSGWSMMTKTSFTATFTDGTVLEDTGYGFIYEGEEKAFEITTQQYVADPWVANNTYAITITVMGKTVQIPVTILPTPIREISIEPISVFEHSGGWWTEEYSDELGQDVEYYYYSVNGLIDSDDVVVTFTDGTQTTLEAGAIEYNGESYSISASTNQSAQNPWQVNGNYTADFELLGKIVQVPVAVVPSPIESMEFTSVSVIEKTGGYLVSDDDHEQTDQQEAYWYYYPGALMHQGTYTVTFRDGTVLTGDAGEEGFYYNDEWYSFECDSKQSYETPWLPGNTYTMEISAMGASGQMEITIEESPLVSLSFTPISVAEGVDGGWSEDYDEELGEYKSYYRYYYGTMFDRSTFTATFTDGTVLTGNAGEEGFYYEDEWYSFAYDSKQSYETPWLPGNTYSVEVSVMGVSAQMEVAVEASPLVGIEFTPIAIAEETNGWFTEEYNIETGSYETYYYYYPWFLLNNSTFTATFSDGTVVTENAAEGGFWYKGEWYDFDFSLEQTVENPLRAGNTYVVEILTMGQEAELEITICVKAEEEGYTYILQNEQAIITYCTLAAEELEIPETLGGFPVAGIISLGDAIDYAEKIVLPDSVTMLSGNALQSEWYGTIPLRELVLGNGITSLPIKLFTGVTLLEKFTVSEENPYFTVVDDVLYNKDCTVMVMYPLAKTTLHVIPDSVTDIDILFDDSGLFASANFHLGAGIEKYVQVDGVIYTADMTKVVKCTAEATGEYEMPGSVTEIGTGAFANSNLTSIVIADSVTEIAYCAFMGSTQLQQVTLPETVTEIQSGAFSDCSSLEQINIPSSMEMIYGGAFYGCESLRAVNIADMNDWYRIQFESASANPLAYARNLYVDGRLVTDVVIPEDVVEFVYGYSFYNANIQSLTVPSTVYWIRSSAFCGSDIQQLNISEGLQSIGGYAFAETKLTSVVLPDSLQELGWSAFENCASLKSAILGDGLNAIYETAFYGTGLTSIVIPENVQYIGISAFEASALTEVVIESESVYIDNYAFAYCPLEKINLGEFVSYIGRGAFEGTKLYSVSLPQTVTQIGYRTFAANENLALVVIPETVEEIVYAAFEENDISHVLYKGTQAQWQSIYNDSNELNEATIHYDADGDEAYIVDGCTGTMLYCSICDKWEMLKAKSGSHDYETVVQTRATTTKDGKIIYVCADCGHEATNGKTIYKANSFKLSTTSYTYDGKVKTPSVTVKDSKGNTLKKDTDYTVTYESGRKTVGTYDVTVKLKGKYSGSKTLSFKINPIDISKCTVKLSTTSYTYDGKVKTPSVTVKSPSGTTLTKNTHYTVSYASGRKNAGTYKVTVTMKGVFGGSKTLSFKINPINISKCTVKLSATSYTYNGGVKTPSVTVKNASGTTLTKNTHYTVSYASGRKNVGTYKVTVTMKGNYGGSKTLTFKILPKATSISKLTAKTKALTVALNKQTTQTTGYQIQYSTSKSFSSYKTVTITSNKTTSKTISGLKAKTTYYVRVRTYKTVSSVKYYSGWSAVKSLKTK